jgi:hypothetical protein
MSDMLPYESALPPTEEKPRKWRREKYEELAFTPEQAARLADSRDSIGFFVYWGDVADVLAKVKAKGVEEPHLVVFDIFSDQVPS